MRRYLLLLLLLLVVVRVGWPQGVIIIHHNPSNIHHGFATGRTITIDHTKVNGTDQTNFPVLISGTFSWLKTIANGGNLTSSSGFDVVYTSDPTCGTRLKWETESWNGSTGVAIYWVKIPSVSHTVDTVFYQCYQNGAITTDQSDPHNVWDSNYKGVWHLPNGSSLTANDSTVNGNNGTVTTATAASGQIDGAAAFVSISGDRIVTTYTTDPTTITWEAWFFNTGDTGASGAPRMLVMGDTSSTMTFQYNGSGSGDTLDFNASFSTTLGEWTVPNPANSTWHHLGIIYDGTSTSNVPAIYIDGTLQTLTTISTPVGTIGTGAGGFEIGNRSSHNRGWCGRVDEVRYSTSLRAGDWIITSKNNQLNPGTFSTIGSPYF